MKTQNKSVIIHHLIVSIYWSRNLSHNSITAQAAITNNLATYMFTTRKQEVHLIASLNLFFHRNYTLENGFNVSLHPLKYVQIYASMNMQIVLCFGLHRPSTKSIPAHLRLCRNHLKVCSGKLYNWSTLIVRAQTEKQYWTITRRVVLGCLHGNFMYQSLW